MGRRGTARCTLLDAQSRDAVLAARSPTSTHEREAYQSLSFPPFKSIFLYPEQFSSTNLRRNPLEQLQHSQRVQILLSLPNMRPQFLILPNCTPKSLHKLLPLHLRLLRPVFLVDDLERADLLDGSVGGAAVGAVDDLAAGRVYGFGGGLTSEVFEMRGTEAAEVGSTIGFVEEDVGAGLRERGWKLGSGMRRRRRRG